MRLPWIKMLFLSVFWAGNKILLYCYQKPAFIVVGIDAVSGINDMI